MPALAPAQAPRTTPTHRGGAQAALPLRSSPPAAAAASRAAPLAAAPLPRSGGAAQPPPPLFAALQAQAGQALAAAALTASLLVASPASARLEGVNKPELLPPGPPVPVLDVAGFLTPGETARLAARVTALETDTGVRLRVLAQNYPTTPGLAIRDYWAVDDNTVVFVADPNTGNILNFNVGAGVDLRVPRSFWSRLASKFGTKKYWTEAGQEAAIVNAVNAIDVCLREPMGVGQCGKVADSVM